MNQELLLEEYIEKYGRLIFSICYSMTCDYFESEDLAQDTFLSAYRNLGKFDGENAKSWLTKIAANKCKDYLKSAARRSHPTEQEKFDSLGDGRPSIEETIMQKEIEDKLKRLCKSLKEPYQTMATSYFINHLNSKEIAEKSGKNKKTVETQIYRAKAMLRKKWKEEEG